MIFRSLLLVFLLLFLLAPQETLIQNPRTSSGETATIYKDSVLSGRVVGIADGDTFTLLLPDHSTVKIRVASIDCPERRQPFSSKARQFTAEAIFEKDVQVAIDSKDRYGRYIAFVQYENRDLGEELLKHGLAWHFVRYSNSKILQKLEDSARLKKIGLWSDPQAIPPWEWRKGVRPTARASD